MTERSMGSAVAGAHRTIRVLGEGEGPFPGVLVTRGEGVAVRTPAEQLRGWAGWALAGAEHVAAPIDIVLRTDGHDVLLPWCVRTVSSHLASRKADDGVPRGEAVTLAVSILRGVLELAHGDAGGAPVRRRAGAGEAEPRGRWWLTDEGRPVFAIGVSLEAEGEMPWASAQRLLRDLECAVEDRALRRLLLRLAEATEDPRRLRAEVARWEEELLEIAAPRTLHVVEADQADPRAAVSGAGERHQDPLLRRRDLRPGRDAPRRATDAVPRRSESRKGHRKEASLAARVRARARVVAIGRHAVAELFARGAERMSPRGRHGTGPVAPALPAGRRRWIGPAIVAASAATVIAVGGALWPTGDGSAGAVDVRPSESAASPRAGAEGTASPPADPTPTVTDTPRRPQPSADQDTERAGQELISAALRCQTMQEPACADLWNDGPGAMKPVRDQGGSVSLIEDYGDIAAMRSGSGEGAQMIVIMRRDAEWRIRDVYDIADPPSEGAGAP